MKLYKYFLVWIIICASLYPKHSIAMEIVEDHKAVAVIVIDSTTSEKIISAAKILQSYIAKSTGAVLPIYNHLVKNKNTVYVGANTWIQHINTSELRLDGFLLNAVDDASLIIIGGSDVGTLNGVYDFLERYLGIRWLMPTQIGIDIPNHSSLNISPSKIIENPIFYSRQVTPGKPFQEWNEYNRVNQEIITVGSSLFKLFPPSEFKQTHPEFYPIINGKRFIPSTDDKANHWQPNFSAKGIDEVAAQKIIEFFKTHPQAISYSLGMNDAAEFDESSQSLARRNGKVNYLGLENVSDDYFMWANAVAEKVLKVYPNKLFGVLAYRSIAEPPDKIAINSNIIPYLTYERMRWANPALRKSGEELTERWSNVSPVIGWYDYAYGLGYMVPRVWFHTMQNYLSWGADHNVKYYYAEVYPNWGNGPKEWVLAKLLWNPHQNVDSLVNDWYLHAVGAKAAPKLQEFYSVWEHFWTVDIFNSAWNKNTGLTQKFKNPGYLLDVPDDYISKSTVLMNEVVQLADSPLRKQRAEKLLEMWQFFRAAAITYKINAIRNAAIDHNENTALSLLNNIETVNKEKKEMEQLLNKFKSDSLYNTLPESLNHIHIDISDETWGKDLLWQIIPWAKNSALVRKKVEALSKSSDDETRQTAQLILKALDDKVISVSKNNSFEDDLQNWNIISQQNKQNFNTVSSTALDGQKSLSVTFIKRSGIMQVMPYSPGIYYATFNCSVTEDSLKGNAKLTLQILDKNNTVIKDSSAPHNLDLQLINGKWTKMAIPFSVQNINEAAKLRLIIMFDKFNFNTKIHLDNIGVYKIKEQ